MRDFSHAVRDQDGKKLATLMFADAPTVPHDIDLYVQSTLAMGRFEKAVVKEFGQPPEGQLNFLPSDEQIAQTIAADASPNPDHQRMRVDGLNYFSGYEFEKNDGRWKVSLGTIFVGHEQPVEVTEKQMQSRPAAVEKVVKSIKEKKITSLDDACRALDMSNVFATVTGPIAIEANGGDPAQATVPLRPELVPSKVGTVKATAKDFYAAINAQDERQVLALIRVDDGANASDAKLFAGQLLALTRLQKAAIDKFGLPNALGKEKMPSAEAIDAAMVLDLTIDSKIPLAMVTQSPHPWDYLWIQVDGQWKLSMSFVIRQFGSNERFEKYAKASRAGAEKAVVAVKDGKYVSFDEAMQSARPDPSSLIPSERK